MPVVYTEDRQAGSDGEEGEHGGVEAGAAGEDCAAVGIQETGGGRPGGQLRGAVDQDPDFTYWSKYSFMYCLLYVRYMIIINQFRHLDSMYTQTN